MQNRTRPSGWRDKDANGKTDWNVSNYGVACVSLTNHWTGLTITTKQFVQESRRQGKLPGNSRIRFPGRTWECISSEYGDFNIIYTLIGQCPN